MDSTYWIIALEWLIRVGFSLRVIMRRQPVGFSLAWVTIILLVPFLGAALYFLIGEKRLGYYRAKWVEVLAKEMQPWRDRLRQFEETDWSTDNTDAEQLARLVRTNCGSPALSGNTLELLESAERTFHQLIGDIDKANVSCDLEYYIWEVGGLADDVAESLCRAARRGVACRLLVDSVGSRGFLRSQQIQRLKADGVKIRSALPSNLFRALFYRFDLRLHRKIVVIDQCVAYVGSQNMADPKLFQAGAGYGQWIDAMARIRGPAVAALAMTFLEDWSLESFAPETAGESLEELCSAEVSGESTVQVVASGPGAKESSIDQILLNAIYMADQRLVITTPYFVPDESLQTALLSAADRGVDVTIVLPEKVNSRFVRLASRAFLRELCEAGVMIARYGGGMLHTKSLIVDHDVCMFGSLNLDPRSLHLNFEITLLVYDQEFADSLSRLQEHYLSGSHIVSIEELTIHSLPVRALENCSRLVSPLL